MVSDKIIYRNFFELEVWKKARMLKNKIFLITGTFPKEEKYRLADQLIRSSRSITSNIAEGHGRYSFKDQLHFCVLARGSLSECFNHLIDAYDCKYISLIQLKSIKELIEEVGRLLNGYVSFLKKQIPVKVMK